MNKGNKKNSQKQIAKYENHNISQDRLIEIQAEAYYRALKKVEQEKTNTNELVTEKQKEKWYIYILFVLNALVFPWIINKRFSINKGIYDSILVLFVSFVLWIIGTLMWFFGLFLIIFTICETEKVGISSIIFMGPFSGILSVFLGSLIVLASSEFSKEMDSNKIYAYSACIIAFISCVVSIITLLKM